MEFRADIGRLNGYKAGQQWQSTAGLGKKGRLFFLYPYARNLLGK
jgi:hypothetical protein